MHPPLYYLLGAVPSTSVRCDWACPRPPVGCRALPPAFARVRGFGRAHAPVPHGQVHVAQRVGRRTLGSLAHLRHPLDPGSRRLPLSSCLAAGVLSCLDSLAEAPSLSGLGLGGPLRSLSWRCSPRPMPTPGCSCCWPWSRHARSEDKFGASRVWQAGLCWVVSAASIFLATQLRAAKVGATACHRAIGTICNITSEHFVGNTWANYLTFDLRFFLGQPYLINDPHDPKRDYFLNTFLKSSLLSAMPLGPEFDDRLSATLATVSSYLARSVCSSTCWWVCPRPFSGECGGTESCSSPACSCWVHWLRLRVKVPLSMHADFRYVFPLLVPACVWYSKVIEHWQRQIQAIFLAGRLLAGLLVLASVLFFRPEPRTSEGALRASFRTHPLLSGHVLRDSPVGHSRRRPTRSSVRTPSAARVLGAARVLARGRFPRRRRPVRDHGPQSRLRPASPGRANQRSPWIDALPA